MDPARVFQGEITPPRPQDSDLPAPPVSGEPETLLNITSSEDTFKIMPASAPATIPCPRCGAPLVSPETLGLCEKCGYCRSLSAPRFSTKAEPAQPGRSLLGFVRRLRPPEWVCVLLCGLAGISLISALASASLPTNSPEQMLWSTLQFSVGTLAILAAQVWALMLLLPADATLGLADLLVPFRLWRRAAQQLPQTCWPVSLALWGAALSASALAFLGHVSFRPSDYQREAVPAYSEWYIFKPHRELREALLSWDEDSDKPLWESAAQHLAGKTDLATRAEVVEADNDSRPVVQCVVIGYIPGADGMPATLVLGAAQGGKLRFTGLARQGLGDVRSLLHRLEPLQRRETPVRGATGLKAIWVKPELLCEVQHSGLDEQGTLREPRIKRLGL